MRRGTSRWRSGMRLGLVGFVGDPPLYYATVRINKDGYQPFSTKELCNGHFEGLPVDADLEPNPARIAPKKNSSL